MINIQKNVPLKDYSNYKIGGPASFFVQIKRIDDIPENIQKFKRIFVLGSGTNVLISDKGFDGLVIHNNLDSIVSREAGSRPAGQKENELHVGAGVLLPDVASYAIEHSLSGLEWAGGLPGTIGGAVRGNAGAFGGEIKDQIVEVESMNLFTREIKKRTNRQCQFGYRSSIFKINESSEMIISVALKLSREAGSRSAGQKGDKEEIQRLTQEKIDYRNARHPLEYPNIGSTFKNIALSSLSENLQKEFKDYVKDDPFPVVTTTKLLALAGLKGRRVGDAQISDKHPNFIVNLGDAKSSDVLSLIKIAKETIKNKWGIELEEEITYLK